MGVIGWPIHATAVQGKVHILKFSRAKGGGIGWSIQKYKQCKTVDFYDVMRDNTKIIKVNNKLMFHQFSPWCIMHGHKIIHENSNSIQTVNNLISLHRFLIKALYHLDLLYICVLNRVCKPSLRDILAILYYTRYVLRLSSFLSNWAINMFTWN